MSEALPELPEPTFFVIRIGSSMDVPVGIADKLRINGIPGGFLGYEYRPLGEGVYLGRINGSRLIAIGTSGLFGRICVDAESEAVVQISKIDSRTFTHVNRSLESFAKCVAAVIELYPFYSEQQENDEVYHAAATEVRQAVFAIDNTALSHNGFWMTLYDDIAMGSYPSQ
jgi:hypothetical protein